MLQSRKQFLKNTGLLIGASALLKQKVFSNYSPLACPEGYCSADLANTATTPYVTIGTKLNKQYGNGTSPGDVRYADENNASDPCTSASTTCLNNDNALVYDVYYPDEYDFANCPLLPAVIYAHGGGFSDCSDRSLGVTYCTEFAKRGFVTFNIEYRSGIQLDDFVIPTGSYVSASQALGSYRTFQDVRGAIKAS